MFYTNLLVHGCLNLGSKYICGLFTHFSLNNKRFSVFGFACLGLWVYFVPLQYCWTKIASALIFWFICTKPNLKIITSPILCYFYLKMYYKNKKNCIHCKVVLTLSVYHWIWHTIVPVNTSVMTAKSGTNRWTNAVQW